MKTNLGCLSIPAIFSALFTLFAIVGVAYASGGSLFSAGDLNAETGEETLGGVTSHMEIGGRCPACHTAPWESDTMADRCMVCHTEIRVEFSSADSLHGGISQGFPSRNCRDCHPEHRGAHASLLEMDLSDYPHTNLNFSLQSHLEIACVDCHTDGYKNPFNLSTCVYCHYSLDAGYIMAHSLGFGTECLNCHDGLETLGSDFDHNLFPFSLKGRHAETVCTSCHLDARSLNDLQSTPQDCYSCHQSDDPHGGRLGTDCAVCHNPDSWEPYAFDHSLTGYILDGKHVEVTCDNCHVGEVYYGTPRDCVSCHAADDHHNSQLGTDCAACHSTAGWDQVNINHSLFAFPLTGAHINTTCESCHQNGVFKGTPLDCNSCHQKDEPHEGRFGTDCAACHTTDAWKPANFDHNLAAFKLTGSHVNAACESCHQNGVYRGTPQDCYSCHRGKDKHNGQFGTNCGSCHSTSSWKGATFNHNLSRFPLTGRHASLSCERCHAGGRFSGTSSACVSCHSDPAYHAGVFGTNCASCHNTNNWSATYRGSHPGIANEGGSGVNHGNTSCRTCHTSNLHSATCTACHDGNGGEGGGGGDD